MSYTIGSYDHGEDDAAEQREEAFLGWLRSKYAFTDDDVEALKASGRIAVYRDEFAS